ncbi:MAG: zinc-dependent metalloprotease [Planctomycetota bacterium]
MRQNPVSAPATGAAGSRSTRRLSRTRWARRGALGLAGLFCVASAVLWASPDLARAQDAADASGESDSPFPPLSELTEGLEEVPGLMTLWRTDPSDPTQDPTTLLCRVPASLLDQDLLFATSVSRGPLAGFQWVDALVRWQIVGQQLVLTAPDIQYVQQDDGNPIASSVARTYRPAYLASVPILTMAGGDPVVDLASLVFSRVARPPMGGPVNRSLSVLTKVKNFPENVLIDADLAFPDGQGGAETMGVSYAFRKLPDLSSGYASRPADERVGYFTTTRIDFAKPHAARELEVRLINRWRLEKQDPSLALSPPKEPIVFVIEKTVPIRWRRWVRAGIEDWNRSFEQIGFSGAIVVQQQTDTNEFADVDPEDARYNFVQWIVTGRGFAVGPSRADPRTGEILDADIVIDDGMLRFYAQDFDLYGPKSLGAGLAPELLESMLRRPALYAPGLGAEGLAQLRDIAHQRAHPACSHPSHQAQGSPAAPGGLAPRSSGTLDSGDRPRPEPIHAAHGQHDPDHAGCSYSAGMMRQMALAAAAARASGIAGDGELPDEIIGPALQAVVTHEVGHTLGLRHNFKASGWLTLEEIKQRRDTGDKPTSASTMDYNPLLLFAGDTAETLKRVTSTGPGPYDDWAIEYGYAVPEPGQSEQELLASITNRAGEPALAFLTDEDTRGLTSLDPLAAVWEASSEPGAWAASRRAIADTLLADVQTWAREDGEPRYVISETVNALLFEKGWGYYQQAKMVGGQYFHRHRGDEPGAKPALVLVPAQEQRQALTSLCTTVFAPGFVALEPELLNNMASPRWGYSRSRIDFPIHQRIAAIHGWTLGRLTEPATLQRIYDAELKSSEADKFTLAELLTTLSGAVWSELDQAPGDAQAQAQAWISTPRRNLQSMWISALEPLARPTGWGSAAASPDVSRMGRQSLADASAKIAEALQAHEGSMDFGTRAHLEASRSKIDRLLDATYDAEPSGLSILFGF